MTATERKIIHIDEDKCNGCGLCVTSCAEGAIQIVDGKAKLVSESYCDGLGACLGPCPTGALTIVTREAEAFDQAAADRHVENLKAAKARENAPAAAPAPAHGHAPNLGCGCPGSMAKALKPKQNACCAEAETDSAPRRSELMNWPVQLMLVPPGAPYLQGADLLLAADCAAFADSDFHRRFLKGRPVVIACPKLDDPEPRIAKLAAVLEAAKPASVTVARMEVPCCGGLVAMTKEAIRRTGLDIPLHIHIVGIDGTPRQAQ